MTLQEVIQALQSDEHGRVWIRPAGWHGCAFCLGNEGRELLFVPTLKGGASVMTTRVNELLGEWEVVPVVTVLDELDEMRDAK